MLVDTLTAHSSLRGGGALRYTEARAVHGMGSFNLRLACPASATQPEIGRLITGDIHYSGDGTFARLSCDPHGPPYVRI